MTTMTTDGLNAQAAGFAQRAQAVMDGVPGLDHQTIAATAQNTTSPDQAVQTGSNIADTLRQTWDGFSQSYDDPILHQQPSQALATAQFFHSTFGAPPIEAGPLQEVQQTLKDAGLGTDLPADGAWTQQWQQTWNAQMNNLYQDQVAGDRPGAMKTSDFLHRVLHTFTPAGIGDSFVGWAKDVRNLGADSLATVANTPKDVEDLFSGDASKTFTGFRNLTTLPLGAIGTVVEGKQAGLGHTAQQLGADVESIGGPKVSAEQYQQQLGALRAVSDALTVLSMTGLGGIARSTIGKVGEDFARGLLPADAPEVTRAPGMIAKTLFKASDATSDVTLPDDELISPHWYTNMPVLGRLAPAVAKSAEADGWYYTARNFLAQPYRVAAVRAAGDVASGLQQGALGLQGAALATPGTQFSKNIAQDKTLDALSTNIANIGPRFYGWSPTDPNNLQLLLHGPLGRGGAVASASESTGQIAKAANDQIIDALGAKGFGAAVQQALRKGNKIPSQQEMQDWVGGNPLAYNQFMRAQAIKVAHDFYVERTIGKNVAGGTDAATVDRVAQLEDEFWKTPGVAQKALQDALEGDNDVQNATNRLTNYYQRQAESPRAAFKKDYDEWYQTTKEGQAASGLGDTKFFVTPKANALIGAHNESVEAPPFFTTPEETAQTAAQKLAPTSENVQRILPNEPGMFGLARNDYKTGPDVENDANAFQAQLDAARAPGGNGNDELKITKAMRRYLNLNAGRDARELDLFTPTADKLVQAIRDFGSRQAGNVTLSIDAPDAVHERFAALQARGYKWVVGSHIGHVIDGTEPDLGQLEGYTKPLRAFAQRSGLNPSNIRDTDIGRASHLSMQQALIDARRNDSRIKWPALVTAHTIMGLLTQDKAIDDMGLPWYSGAILRATRNVGTNKSTIKYLMDSEGLTKEAAGAKLEASLAYQQSVRDLPTDKIVATLETPKTVTTQSGGEWNYPGMDHTSAVLTARALNRGFKLPTYMMGLSAIENWARAGFGFGDRIATAHPDNNLIQRVANWPNSVVRLRNQLRFTINPKFDFQRATKTGYKMGLEGVTPQPNPLGHLMEQGGTAGATKAASTFERVVGKLSPEDAQQLDADKYAQSQSIFGAFSPKWSAIYHVNEKLKQGATDEEAKASYYRAFTYGSGGGRSALERSINTVFFPFSFEKTVIRNGVGYLMDHTGQAMLLSAGVDAWKRADKNDVVGNWIRGHLPVLAEMNQLNTFSHGISLGEFGGINAPIINPIVKSVVSGAEQPAHNPSQLLLNLFLPQNWGKNYTKATLQQYLPVWKEFGQVWQTATDQAQVGWNVAANTRDDVLRKQTADRTLIAPSQQLGYALQKKADLVNQAQSVIDFNAKQSDDSDKVSWPYNPKLPATIQGKPVDKTTIGQWVQAMYPAYSPTAAASAAQSKAVAADAFIRNVAKTDPAMATDMTNFKNVANQVIGKINDDKYDHATLASVQGNFRQAAINLSEKSPQWLAFYDKFYRSSLGPIEDWTGKGVTK